MNYVIYYFACTKRLQREDPFKRGLDEPDELVISTFLTEQLASLVRRATLAAEYRSVASCESLTRIKRKHAARQKKAFNDVLCSSFPPPAATAASSLISLAAPRLAVTSCNSSMSSSVVLSAIC